MKGKSILVALFICIGASQPKAQNGSGSGSVDEIQLNLDPKNGKTIGAMIGMDEEAARKYLSGEGVTKIEKVSYPSRFLLQSRIILGLIFHFSDNKHLTDIYINSRKVVFSNGLRPGQSIKEFTEKLGQPLPPTRLPSKTNVEIVYPMDELELAVIVIDKEPDKVKALTLRKRSPTKGKTD